MALTTETLKAEIESDPNGYGLLALRTTGNYQGVCDLLNLVRAGILIKRTDVAAAEVAVAIDVADYTALPNNPTAAALSTERRFLAWLSGILTVASIRLVNDDGSDTPVIKNFKAMFAAGTGTLTRLLALATRAGSRAEQLFGRDVTVAVQDVANTV